VVATPLNSRVKFEHMKTYDRLADFVQNRMRMSHVHQSVPCGVPHPARQDITSL
jgi:hypothetical protein